MDDHDQAIEQSLSHSIEAGASQRKKKCKIYKQRYLEKWEQDWRFEGWLTQCKEDPDYAYCRVCHTRVLARVASLTAHYNAVKHKKKMKLAGIDWLSDDNQLKQEKKIIKFDKFGLDKSNNEFDVEYADLDFYEATSHDYEENDPEYITDASVKNFDEEFTIPRKRKQKKFSEKPFKFELDSSSLNLDDSIGSSTPRESSLTFSVKDDEFSVYGKHVANELRQVADDFAQQAAKMKINTILYEARTGQYRPNTSQSVATSSTHQQGSYEFVVCPTISQ